MGFMRAYNLACGIGCIVVGVALIAGAVALPVAALGLGITLGTWLSIPAVLLPPLIGFSLRLSHEERVLERELGDPYRDYMRRTRRLVPGIW